MGIRSAENTERHRIRVANFNETVKQLRDTADNIHRLTDQVDRIDTILARNENQSDYAEIAINLSGINSILNNAYAKIESIK